jgi:hypothetical protein
MKTKTILIAAVMFLALSVSAFAQASFTVSSSPVTTVACCGQTERSGDITLTPILSTANTVTGTVEVIYPVPITNPLPYAPGPSAPSVIAVSTGGTAPGVSINSVSNDATGKGIVVFNINAGGTGSYFITLRGVRVNVSDKPAGSLNLVATLAAVNNYLTAGEVETVVIRFIAQPLAAPRDLAPVTINGVTGAQNNTTTTLTISEGFLDAFGVTAVTDPSQNISKMIRLKVSAVPAGVTVTFPINAGNFQLASAAGAISATAAALTSLNTPVSIYYRVMTDTDPQTLENFAVTITVGNTAPYPLAAGAVTVTAHIAPIDTNFIQTLIPRYADLPDCETASATIVTIFGASTTLLVPYATTYLGYDTGIAVANTTTDPTTAKMGFTQAVKQTGKVTFYLYPQKGGAPIVYTTASDSPGDGLDTATGNLPTGQLYTVMLSQIIDKKGVSDFAGYIFIITDFTNAHGEYFISDFLTFTHGALMLVVNRDSRGGPESLNN